MARYPVQEEGGQTSLEQDRAPRDEVRDGLSLLLKIPFLCLLS